MTRPNPALRRLDRTCGQTRTKLDVAIANLKALRTQTYHASRSGYIEEDIIGMMDQLGQARSALAAASRQLATIGETLDILRSSTIVPPATKPAETGSRSVLDALHTIDTEGL